MFEFYTEKALKAIVSAQNESRRFKRNYVGVEHLLLGLSLEKDGFAAIALDSQNASTEKLRQQVEKICGYGKNEGHTEIFFTPRIKRVLELAWDEARKLEHNYIGTEHLLLAITREGESVASRALAEMRVDIPSLDDEIRSLLSKKCEN